MLEMVVLFSTYLFRVLGRIPSGFEMKTSKGGGGSADKVVGGSG